MSSDAAIVYVMKEMVAELRLIRKALEMPDFEETVAINPNCMRCTYFDRTNGTCKTDHCRWEEEND